MYYLDLLSKDILLQYLTGKNIKKSMKKEAIIEKLEEEILKDSKLYTKIYNENKIAFGVKPSELEETLKISKNERKLFEALGKFQVVGKDGFNKYGTYIEYSLYDRIQINSITEEEINSWRREHEAQKKINRQKAVEKSKQTKEKNKESVNKLVLELEEEFVKWEKIDYKLSLYYKLAFWTVWVSRWAKEYQLKSFNAKKNETKEKYNIKKEEMYSLKNKAMEVLFKSNLFNLYFYKPENADKISDLFLCERHYEDWVRERSMYFEHYGLMDYFMDNKKEISNCPYCSFSKEKDYYSLYYLELNSSKIEDFSFSFHIPYSLGKNIFPNKNKLKRVKHEENRDGIFRFGRSLEEEEVILYKNNFVLKNFNNVLKEINKNRT